MYGASFLILYLDAPSAAASTKPFLEPLIVDIECPATDSPQAFATPARPARLSLERRHSTGTARTLPSPSTAAAAAAGVLPVSIKNSNHSSMHTMHVNSVQPHYGHAIGHANGRSNGHVNGVCYGANGSTTPRAGASGGDDAPAPRLERRSLLQPRRRNGSTWQKRAAAPLQAVACIP